MPRRLVSFAFCTLPHLAFAQVPLFIDDQGAPYIQLEFEGDEEPLFLRLDPYSTGISLSVSHKKLVASMLNSEHEVVVSFEDAAVAFTPSYRWSNEPTLGLRSFPDGWTIDRDQGLFFAKERALREANTATFEENTYTNEQGCLNLWAHPPSNKCVGSTGLWASRNLSGRGPKLSWNESPSPKWQTFIKRPLRTGMWIVSTTVDRDHPSKGDYYYKQAISAAQFFVDRGQQEQALLWMNNAEVVSEDSSSEFLLLNLQLQLHQPDHESFKKISELWTAQLEKSPKERLSGTYLPSDSRRYHTFEGELHNHVAVATHHAQQALDAHNLPLYRYWISQAANDAPHHPLVLLTRLHEPNLDPIVKEALLSALSEQQSTSPLLVNAALLNLSLPTTEPIYHRLLTGEPVSFDDRRRLVASSPNSADARVLLMTSQNGEPITVVERWVSSLNIKNKWPQWSWLLPKQATLSQ